MSQALQSEQRWVETVGIVMIVSRNIKMFCVHFPIVVYLMPVPAIFVYGNLPPCLIPLDTFFSTTLYTLKFFFELTVDVTYQQYVYAARSGRVLTRKLLPPEYLIIRLWFRYQHDFHHKLHHSCPGIGSWHGELGCKYDFTDEIISDLINQKDQFWCQHCEWGLFFPKTCKKHPDGNVEEEEAE